MPTWNLALFALIGLWLLFTRLCFGRVGRTANADHVIGSLVLTGVSLAEAEVARPLAAGWSAGRGPSLPFGGTSPRCGRVRPSEAPDHVS